MIRTPQIASLLCVWLAACHDGADVRPSIVRSPQILALESEPPEAAPGQSVSYSVLAIDDRGRLTPEDLQLSYCRTPKAIGDNRVASDACAFEVESDAPIDKLPSDACARFGPNAPSGVRPPDPDPTGGYYQPIRVAFDGLTAVGLQRLRCPLGNAPIALTQEFRARYVPNRNPELMPLSIELDGAPVTDDVLPRDRELTLRASWPASSRESYLMYDAFTVSLIERRESLRVSWFVTQGELAYDHTGRAADDPALWTENRWRTPETPGTWQLWVVLRDDRGGSAHAGYELHVR